MATLAMLGALALGGGFVLGGVLAHDDEGHEAPDHVAADDVATISTTSTSSVTATIPRVTAPVLTTTTTPRPELVVTGVGVSTAIRFQNLVASVGAVIRNESPLVALNVTVTVNLKDATGAIVKSETTHLPFVPANSEVYAGPSVFLSQGAPAPVTAEAQVHAARGQQLNIQSFTFSDVSYRSDQFGRVVGTITSPFAMPVTSVYVNCVLFQGSNVVGGGFTFVAVVPAGQSTGFEIISGPIPGLTVDSVRCSGTVSNLSSLS